MKELFVLAWHSHAEVEAELEGAVVGVYETLQQAQEAMTENVEETVSTAINAGATLVEKPKTKPWGQVVAYVRDIDGFLIEICTQMG